MWETWRDVKRKGARSNIFSIRSEWLEPEEITEKIAENTRMSYRWVVKYLLEKYKDTA